MKSRTKIIAVATAACAGVAMVSVGFASWVITNNATQEAQGAIKVDTVTDERLALTATVASDDVVCYGYADKVDGKPAWLTNEGTTTKEDLSFDLTIKVTKGTVSSAGIKVTITAPTSDAYVAAVEAGCIGDMKKVTVKNGSTVLTAETTGTTATSAVYTIDAATINNATDKTVTLTVTFAWGTAFGEDNPMTYYADKNVDGSEGLTTTSTITNWGDHAYENLKLVEAIGDSVAYTVTVEGAGTSNS